MSVEVPRGPPGVPWVIYRTKTKLSAPGIHLSGFRCPVLIRKYGKNAKKQNEQSQRGVCKGCVQGVCKGCYLTPNRNNSRGGSGQHFFTFCFIASRGRHVMNRCLGLFVPVFRARRADCGPDSWLGQGSKIASRKTYLEFLHF